MNGLPVDSIVLWLKTTHNAYPVVGVLLLMIGMDILLGLGIAVLEKTLSSTISQRGMIRKVGMLLLVGMCAVIEPYAGDIPVSKLASMCFIATEFTSILEKAKKLGIPIPSVIADALNRYMEEDQRHGDRSSVRVDIHQETVDVHPTGLKETTNDDASKRTDAV